MKLLIDIPKEFEQHFQADRFDDSLHRLIWDANLLAGRYEQETALMLSEALKNAVCFTDTSNYGRIIQKSPEELAKWIAGYVLNLTDASLEMATEAWVHWFIHEA